MGNAVNNELREIVIKKYGKIAATSVTKAALQPRSSRLMKRWIFSSRRSGAPAMKRRLFTA